MTIHRLHSFFLRVVPALLTLCAVACSGDKKTESEIPPADSYTLQGSIDTVLASDTVYLYIDNHDTLISQALPLDRGNFSWQGTTTGIDELYLSVSPHAEYHLYAIPRTQITLHIDSIGNPVFVAGDTLNGWLQQTHALLRARSEEGARRLADSICTTLAYSPRAALLLREALPTLTDSLYVRRLLGKLKPEAKPQWLMDKIDDYMDAASAPTVRGQRLQNFTFSDQEGKTFTLRDQKENNTLLTFWADYDTASLHSLQTLDTIARNYGLYTYEDRFRRQGKNAKRLDMLTFCLHASDSAAWLAAIRHVPGRHVWLRHGFNEPALQTWSVTALPANMIIDRIEKLQNRNLFGPDLDYAVSRLSEKRLKTEKQVSTRPSVQPANRPTRTPSDALKKAY